jgi:putative aldouronate transport system substrate-binding protein
MKKNRSTIRFIRFLSIMLIVLLIVSTVIGCTKSDDGSKTSISDKPDSTSDLEKNASKGKELPEPGVLPLVTEPTTLTIGIAQHALTTDYEDNDFTKLVEEVTGVSLDFVLFPTDGTEAKQKFSLMVSANQELPDIMCMGFSDVERFGYGSNGVFVPLNDYFDNNAYFFYETLKKWASEKEIENVFKYGTSPDGNIYAYPSYYIDPGDASALGCWINKKWLDNLDLNVPTTTEEFYEALKAFYDNDANGNGNPGDEIPLIGHKDWKGSVTDYLVNSFIYANDTNLNAENRKLYAPYITDEWREGLRYIHKLVKEGLLSPLSFSQSSG